MTKLHLRVDPDTAAEPLDEAPPAPATAPLEDDVPAHAVVLPPPGPDPAPLPLRYQAAAVLHARGILPDVLSAVALMFGVGAALVFLTDHPGMAALFGFGGLVLGDLSVVPVARGPQTGTARARLLLPLTDLAMAAGLAGGLAAGHAPIAFFLGLIFLVLTAWLPFLEVTARPCGPWWTRRERLALVLLGALVGGMGQALMAVVCVGSFEVWARLQRPRALMQPRTGLGAHCLTDDDGLAPAVRWSAFAAVAILIIALPQSADWRF